MCCYDSNQGSVQIFVLRLSKQTIDLRTVHLNTALQRDATQFTRDLPTCHPIILKMCACTIFIAWCSAVGTLVSTKIHRPEIF